MAHAHFLCLLMACFNPTATQGADDLRDDPVLQGRTFASWVHDLHSRDPKKRLPAIVVMGLLGPQAKGAVPEISIALNDRDVDLRVAAAEALGRIGPDDQCFAYLLTAEKDQDPDVRRVASAALWRWYPTLQARVTALLKATGTGHGYVVTAARDALFRLGPADREALPLIVDCIKGTSDLNANLATAILARMGPTAKEAVPALLPLLEPTTDVRYRVRATNALGSMLLEPHLVVPALAKLLISTIPSTGEKYLVTQTLGKFESAARDALPALHATLADKDPMLRMYAAETILKITPDDVEATSVIRTMLHQGSAQQRMSLISRLCHRGPAAKALVRELGELLSDPDVRIVGQAALALERLGKDAKPAQPALFKAARNPNRDVSWAAARVLSVLQPTEPEVWEELLALLAHEETRARAFAGRMLTNIKADRANIKPLYRRLLVVADAKQRDAAYSMVIADIRATGHARNHPEILEVLLELCKHEKVEIRRDAFGGLVHFQDSAQVMSLCKEALQDRDETTRIWAAIALENSSLKEQAVRVLVAGLHHPDLHVRNCVCASLARCGPAGKAALPVYLEWIKTDDAEKNQLASECLFSLGDEAKTALPAMIEAITRKPATRVYLLRALGRFGADAKTSVPTIRDLARGGDIDQRLEAALAWLQIDPDDAGPRAILEEFTHHQNSYYRKRAEAALAKAPKRKLKGNVSAPVHFLLLLQVCLHPTTTQVADNPPDDPVLQGRRLADWVKDLESKLPQKRIPAIAVMGALGPKARPYLPQLRNIARDTDGDVRVALASALGSIGGEEAFGVLLVIHGDKDGQVRAVAAAAMQKVCPTPRDRIRALVTARISRDRDISNATRSAFREFGPNKPEAVPELIALLSHADLERRVVACDALREFGAEAEEAVPALVKALADSPIRARATSALGGIARRPEVAVPALAEWLSEPRLTLSERVLIAHTLQQYGPQAAPALGALRKAFTDSDKLVRLRAAIAVAHIDTDIKDALALLTEALLKDANPAQRHVAAQVLHELGPKAKDAMPALIQALDDADPLVTQMVQRALTKLGAGASLASLKLVSALKNERKSGDAYMLLSEMPSFDLDTVKALVELLRDRNARAYASADLLLSTKLQNLNQPDIRAYLLQCLTDADHSVRERVFIYLVQLPAARDETLKHLVAAAKHKDGAIQRDALSFLRSVSIYAESAQAKSVFEAALKNTDIWIRTYAAETLAQRNDRSPQLLPVLMEGMQHEDPQVRNRAVEGIRRFGAGAKDVLTIYREWLRSGDTEKVRLAAIGLQTPGLDAKDVLSDILTVLPHQKGKIRLDLVRTLSVIGPAAKEAVPVLRQMVPATEGNDRLTVLRAWINIEPDAPDVLPPLIDLLKHRTEFVRHDAVYLIGTHRKPSPEVVRALGIALHDQQFRVRDRAAKVVGDMGPAAHPLISELVEGLKYPINGPNEFAVALEKLGDTAVPALRGALSHDNMQVRLRAARILTLPGRPQDEAAMKVLLEVAKSGEPSIRWEAMRYLAYADPEGRHTAPIYVESLKSEDRGVRVSAFLSLQKLGRNARSVAPQVREIVRTASGAKRVEAALALAWLDETPTEGVAAVIVFLKEKTVPPDPRLFPVRAETIRYLGELRAAAKDAVPVLIEFLADPGLNRVALEALDKIGPELEQVRAPLEKLLDHPRLGANAARALLRLDPNHARALERYRTELKNGNHSVHMIQMLSGLGPQARGLLPELRQLANSTEPGVRDAARRALFRIDPPQRWWWRPG